MKHCEACGIPYTDHAAEKHHNECSQPGCGLELSDGPLPYRLFVSGKAKGKQLVKMTAEGSSKPKPARMRKGTGKSLKARVRKRQGARRLSPMEAFIQR